MAEDLDFLSSIQLIALRNVFKGDSFEYIVRKVSRFYSKTFNIPLNRSRQYSDCRAVPKLLPALITKKIWAVKSF